MAPAGLASLRTKRPSSYQSTCRFRLGAIFDGAMLATGAFCIARSGDLSGLRRVSRHTFGL
jgi:hypothetical protein